MSNNNSNHFDPFQNWESQNQSNQQKRLHNLKIKQEYKSRAENALDNLISEFNQAKTNQIADWNPSSKDKAQINRFYKRYWDNNFFAYSLAITIITFVISFYTAFSSLAIFIVFFIKVILSQDSFLKYYLNDYQIDKEDIEYLKNKIFTKQLNKFTVFIVTIILFYISFNLSRYTSIIFIDADKFLPYENVLSRFYPFYMENELFAYTNIFSIFILIFLKVIEKWR